MSNLHGRWLGIVLAAIVSLLGAPALASADVQTAAPEPLVPVGPAGSGAGGIMPMATPMGSTFACNQPVVPVQAQPSGFVIGSCLNGVHIRRAKKSDQYNGTYWDGGYIFGNFARCGWVNVAYSNLVSSTTADLCGGTVGLPTTAYMAGSNDGTDESIHGSCSKHQRPDGSWRCTDGTAVQTIQACWVFANFRPWASGQIPIEPVRVVPAGYTLKWRYVARYYPADGSGHGMIMVRDPGYSAGFGNWVFISAGCLAGLPGLTTNI